MCSTQFSKMAISIDDPNFPSALLHLSEQMLASIKPSQSPVKQTFLLSPTPSEESCRIDSPVLPDLRIQDTLITPSASDNPIRPAWAPSGQNWVHEPAVWQSAARMSDILPDNLALYIDDIPHTRRRSTAFPYSPHQSIAEQDIILGPEVKRELPTIRDHGFPYYPLPSYFPPPRHLTRGSARLEVKSESVLSSKRGTRGFGLKKFLRCAFRKYGVRRV